MLVRGLERRGPHWASDHKQSTIWDIPSNNPLVGGGEEKVGHSTQKPAECMKRPIENNSNPEPFSGSGTTIIAAEMTGGGASQSSLTPPCRYGGSPLVGIRGEGRTPGRYSVLGRCSGGCRKPPSGSNAWYPRSA
ncbi:DNA methyltransferase [Rhodopseudomonas rhenobacensis]|uniref:DNA methyltransferase n=1 Tax=Rhodopseudomonas rhenobacensis TaxID=87461 RepID=UPI0032218D7A